MYLKRQGHLALIPSNSHANIYPASDLCFLALFYYYYYYDFVQVEATELVDQDISQTSQTYKNHWLY